MDALEKLQADNAKLRKALMGLIAGEENMSVEELRSLKEVMKTLPAPTELDKRVGLEAIDVLLETAE